MTPASPFDFEDPERFAPAELPVEAQDFVFVLGVRLERVENGWRCPHGSLYEMALPGALSCLGYHEEDTV